ncbi:3-oxoacyl-ACP reductase [Mycobacterium tuberculosis]
MKLTESNRSPRTTNTTDLSGKVAVVTGAAAGLGRAEALGLARLGATVVVNDVASALDASDVVDEIGAAAADAGAKAVAVAGDISQRATADELLASAVGLGGLDIVVNNAGITRDRMLFNMSDEEWDAVIAVHLRGHFLLTRNAAAYWRDKAKDAEGGSVFGRLVNTSSGAGLVGPVGQANYASAKAGIPARTPVPYTPLTLPANLRGVGSGGGRVTAMTADVFGAAPDVEAGQIDPLSPQHVVSLVQFLASPAAAEVNGQVFIVYGPQVTLVSPPHMERRFSADGTSWDPTELTATLRDYFAGRDPEQSFSATDLMHQ